MPSTDGDISFYAGACAVKGVLILLIMAFLCVSANASDMELIRDQIGIDVLERATPDAAKEIYGSRALDDYSDLSPMVEKLWKFATGQSRDLIFSALRGGAQILSISLLSALCCCFVRNEMVSLAGVLAVSLTVLKSVSSCAEIGREALYTLADYSHVLLPCLCTASAVSGGVTSAGAKYAVSVLVIDGLISVCTQYILPFITVYTLVVAAGQITDHALLQSVGGLLKQCVKWSLIIMTTGFTIYLSMTGLLSGTVDASAAKAAKTAISGALPVVGSILADASSALLSGAQILCGSIGVMGLLAVLAVCLTPYLTLGSHYLVYQLAGSAATSFCDKRIGNVIKGLGDVYAFLLGAVGSVTVMLFVSVVSLMKAVTL